MHSVMISTNWRSSLPDKYLFGKDEEGADEEYCYNAILDSDR